MPHAALWVVQHFSQSNSRERHGCFNAARGFVGGAARLLQILQRLTSGFQCRTRLCGWCSFLMCAKTNGEASGFNAARGFVGGAAPMTAPMTSPTAVSMPHAALWVVQQTVKIEIELDEQSFNAARGFVGGAAKTSAEEFESKKGFNAARGFVGGAADSTVRE